MVAGLVLLGAACTSGNEDAVEKTPAQTAQSAAVEDTTPTTPTTQPSDAAETTEASNSSTTTEQPLELIAASDLQIEAFAVPAGSRPHDVAPAADGGVWYTGQGSGELGWLDPESGDTRQIPLGAGSRPHGVIVGSDGDAWVTDGGLNAIVRVDAETDEVKAFPLPPDRPDANLNTATFDGSGTLWFTGQNGIYGRLDPESGQMEVFDSPNGRGPYGISTAPDGTVFYASLAASFVGQLDSQGLVTVLDPPTPGQGARRVWPDSTGAVWVSEWNSGQLSRYDPATGAWDTWPLPGPGAQTYAVYVDEFDIVWVSDFGTNTMVRFDPATNEWTSLALPHADGKVRQILGRPGEVWGAESSADQLVLIRTVVSPENL